MLSSIVASNYSRLSLTQDPCDSPVPVRLRRDAASGRTSQIPSSRWDEISNMALEQAEWNLAPSKELGSGGEALPVMIRGIRHG